MSGLESVRGWSKQSERTEGQKDVKLEEAICVRRVLGAGNQAPGQQTSIQGLISLETRRATREDIQRRT